MAAADAADSVAVDRTCCAFESLWCVIRSPTAAALAGVFFCSPQRWVSLMPFASVFQESRLIERMLRIRMRPMAGYGIGVVSVAGATLVRWLITGYVIEGLPF